MRLSSNARTGEKTLLMSWRSSSDPSVGNFSAGLNPLGIPEFFIWYNGHPFWRSGPWGGQNFIGIPEMYTSVYLEGFSVQEEADGTFTLSLIQDPVIRATYVLTSHGKFIEQYWDYRKGGWEYTWEAPSTECDIYGKCGPFGSCDAQTSPICTCLKGFVAENKDEWNNGIWTSGCAWKLWNEGDITALVDPAIPDPCFQVEIFRCIQIGLLCVQELAKDRPAVSTISSMLNSEIVDLPPPKKPAFVERQISLDTESITQNQKINSINNVTISDLKGR
ncbi:hypothetical protein NC652_027395 [Populus alba x Populus x berolinensis]|nr:hypothetical protein NC652_027395 [Populus alba x Populus x berolinensis]